MTHLPRLAALAVLAALVCGGCWAKSPFDDLAPLPDKALAQERAGFLDVNGVQFSFGVLTQTFMNGDLGLSTELTVNGIDDVSRAVSGPGAALPDGLGASRAIASADGLTTLLQTITPSAIANVVSTSASNQDIRQSTSVALTLRGFQQNQAAYALQQTVSNLNSVIGLAAMARR